MLSRPFLMLLRGSRTLWIRVVLIAFLAIAALALTPLLRPLISTGLADRFDEDAILPVLKILASGMLAVTTFSLNVMVTSFQSAASQSTPRAYRLLLQDTTTQNVLATYVGSFLFSLCGIVLILASFFGPEGIVIIFGMTVLVIVLIIVTTVRWISHLSHLGSMDHTLGLVNQAITESLTGMVQAPALGGVPMAEHEEPPEETLELLAGSSGYVQFVDMAKLNTLMATHDGRAWITAMPGSFVVEGQTIARFRLANPRIVHDALPHFLIGETRTPEQDARHGLLMLSEIAVRALSPGINDPGTAIDVIRRIEAALWAAGRAIDPDTTQAIRFPLVHAHPFRARALLDEAYAALARDAGDRLDVTACLLDALRMLEQSDWDELAQAATDMTAHVKAQAEAQLDVSKDRADLQRLTAAQEE